MLRSGLGILGFIGLGSPYGFRNKGFRVLGFRAWGSAVQVGFLHIFRALYFCDFAHLRKAPLTSQRDPKPLTLSPRLRSLGSLRKPSPESLLRGWAHSSLIL